MGLIFLFNFAITKSSQVKTPAKRRNDGREGFSIVVIHTAWQQPATRLLRPKENTEGIRKNALSPNHHSNDRIAVANGYQPLASY
jgi:hypothetical protein